MSAKHPHHPCPGCGDRVSTAKFACPACWARLPREAQVRVMNSAWASDTERARTVAAVTAYLIGANA